MLISESKVLSHPTSLNNRIIVEAYVNKAIRAVEKHGFAMIGQKVTLKGLKVLVDAKLIDGTIIEKGSTVYIREDLLHTQAWAKAIFENDVVGSPFIVIDTSYVDFIVPRPSMEGQLRGSLENT